MRVLTSMSDRRTKILLGTSIGALAMIFVMAAGVDAFKTTTTMDSSMLLGHVTIMALNPDGSMSYAHGDNLIMDAGKLTAAEQIFDPAQVAVANVFNCVQLGSGGIAGAAGDAAPTTALQALGQECTDSAACVTTTNCSVGTVAPTGVGLAATTTIIVQFDPLVIADLDPAQAGSSITINEATLENDTDEVLSSVGITSIVGVEGTVVTLTYTMTLS